MPNPLLLVLADDELEELLEELTLRQLVVYYLLRIGCKPPEIAKILNRTEVTIYAEIKEVKKFKFKL